MTYDLDNIYTYHAPKPGQTEKYEAIREAAKRLAAYRETLHTANADLIELVGELCPESRELSMASFGLSQLSDDDSLGTFRLNLESSVMWANAAIAWNE